VVLFLLASSSAPNRSALRFFKFSALPQSLR